MDGYRIFETVGTLGTVFGFFKIVTSPLQAHDMAMLVLLAFTLLAVNADLRKIAGKQKTHTNLFELKSRIATSAT